MEENVGALKVKLSQEEAQELRDMVPEDAVSNTLKMEAVLNL